MSDEEQTIGRVEGGEGILVIRGSANHRAWNGIHYKSGLSAKNVKARHLSMNVATIPPGGVAYAHVHVGFELMLYILSGRVRHEYGPGLVRSIDNEAGDFIFVELRRAARGLQPQRQRARRRGRGTLGFAGVGEHHPLRASHSRPVFHLRPPGRGVLPLGRRCIIAPS